MGKSERYPSPRLLADIGGTNARFALELAPGEYSLVKVLPCDEHGGIEAALRTYLGMTGGAGQQVRHAAIGIATPVLGDQVKLTNRAWSFSIDALRQAFSFETLLVMNDFTALAHALPRLAAADLMQVGGRAVAGKAPLGLIGPGTGLGMAGLIPCDGGHVAIAGEGGHTSFSPQNDEEAHVWQFAHARFGHVSAERLLSGPGLTLIHEAIRAPAGDVPLPLSPAAITRLALAGTDPSCCKAMAMFCAMLGNAAADLALTIGARGGIYIGGGIVPRLGARFVQSPFRQRFEAKGRMRAYLADLPAYVIHAPMPALAGLSAQLDRALQTGGDASTAARR